MTASVGTSCRAPEGLSLFYCILVANKIDVALTRFPLLFSHVGLASGGLKEPARGRDQPLRNGEAFAFGDNRGRVCFVTERPTAQVEWSRACSAWCFPTDSEKSQSLSRGL